MTATQLAAQANAPIPEYTADLQRRIKRAWFPPRGEENKVVVIDFSTNTNGELSKLKVVRSSGSAAADKAALKAIKMAAPFKPMPVGSPQTTYWRYKFDYDHFRGVRASGSGLNAVRDGAASAASGASAASANAGALTAVHNPALLGYIADVGRRVKRAWFPPPGKESAPVLVSFKLRADGSVSDARVTKPSSAADADRAALNALRNAAPMRPFPDGLPADVMELQLTFNKTVQCDTAPAVAAGAK